MHKFCSLYSGGYFHIYNSGYYQQESGISETNENMTLNFKKSKISYANNVLNRKTKYLND